MLPAAFWSVEVVERGLVALGLVADWSAEEVVLLGEVALWLVALWSAVVLVEEVVDALLSGGVVLPPPGGFAPVGPVVDGLAGFCCPCVL